MDGQVLQDQEVRYSAASTGAFGLVVAIASKDPLINCMTRSLGSGTSNMEMERKRKLESRYADRKGYPCVLLCDKTEAMVFGGVHHYQMHESELMFACCAISKAETPRRLREVKVLAIFEFPYEGAASPPKGGRGCNDPTLTFLIFRSGSIQESLLKMAASAGATINVGIVGYGNSTRSFHLPFIQAVSDYKLVAILQRAAAPADPTTAAKGSHCTVDHPSVRHYRTAEEFFANSDINLVVVATTNASHASLAKMALQAGKHVIIDKPFAQSTEEADEVIQLAERKGLIVTCFQNRRWDGDFQTLRHLKEIGALGTVKEAEVHYDFESDGAWFPTQDKYTPGMGMTFALGTHNIDQAVVLFGRPESVTGFFRSQRGGQSDIEDSFTIVLQYAAPQEDLLVTVKSSITTIMSQQIKYIVRGTKGSYFKTQQRSTCPQEEQISSGLSPSDPGFGVEPTTFNGILTTSSEFDAKYQKFDPETQHFVGAYPTATGRWISLYENLAAAVKGTGKLEVQPSQVRDVLRIIELARESHLQSRTVEWS